MKFKLRRTVSCAPIPTVDGVSIDGTHLFTIFRQGPSDRCVPLSALGAIYHRRPQWDATRTPSATVATFEDFELAYATRCDNNVFNAQILAKYQLRERWGLQTPILDPTHALDDALKFVSNRRKVLHPKYLRLVVLVKNTSFVLMLQRPTEQYQHAITVTCDGIWNKRGGFGFQETQYINGYPVRSWKQFETRKEFDAGFATYLKAYNYTDAKIQVVCLEDSNRGLSRWDRLTKGISGTLIPTSKSPFGRF